LIAGKCSGNVPSNDFYEVSVLRLILISTLPQFYGALGGGGGVGGGKK